MCWSQVGSQVEPDWNQEGREAPQPPGCPDASGCVPRVYWVLSVMGHQQGGGAEVGLGAPRISNKPKLGSEVSKSTLTYTWRCTGVTGLLLSSVQFSRSVVSNSFRPHKLQHAGPPCPSQTPGVHPNPCPLSW